MVDIEYNKDLEDEKKAKPNALKISNKNSTFGKQLQERAEAKKWLEESATLSFETKEKRKEASSILISAFWNLINSKELEENKGPNRIKLESNIVSQLIQFGIETNNDLKEEDDGMGSIYLITLCLRSLIKQKERMNQLEYRLSLLEK